MEAETESALNRTEAQIVVSDTGDVAEHKRRLLRQADIHRVGIVHARAVVREAVRPEAMLHRLVERAGAALHAGVGLPTGVRMGALLPLALNALRFLRRRSPAGAVIAGGAMAVAAVYFYRKRRQATQVH